MPEPALLPPIANAANAAADSDDPMGGGGCGGNPARLELLLLPKFSEDDESRLCSCCGGSGAAGNRLWLSMVSSRRRRSGASVEASLSHHGGCCSKWASFFSPLWSLRWLATADDVASKKDSQSTWIFFFFFCADLPAREMEPVLGATESTSFLKVIYSPTKQNKNKIKVPSLPLGRRRVRVPLE